MQQVFVFDRVAVVVMPWWEPMDPPERGARLEVRLLGAEPHRGSRFAAQRIVVDQPVFRADLFDQEDGPPGNLRSAHFHPRFDGVEPSPRHWDEGVKADPLGWLEGELSDLRGLLERAGVHVPGDAGWLDADARSVKEAVPAIRAAVSATWERVRAGEVRRGRGAPR